MNHLVVTAATETGRVRARNEDRVVVGRWILGPGHRGVATNTVAEGGPVAVLDGMGGHVGGEIAAYTAAEVVAGSGLGGRAPSDRAIEDLAHEANAAIYARMEALPDLAGMGSTLAGLVLAGPEVIVFNVGDARVYVEADGYLLAVSTDDAAVSGALTQALGGRSSFAAVRPHLTREPVHDRRFLVASDGLFGHVSDSDLDGCVSDDDRRTVNALVRLALEAGGPDNISVALVRPMLDPLEGGDVT